MAQNWLINLTQEMGMRPFLWQAHAGAARALSALGKDIEAAEHQEKADAVIEEIAALFEDEELGKKYRENVASKIVENA